MYTEQTLQNVQNPPQEPTRDWVSNFFSAILVLLGFFIVYTLSMAARRRRGMRPLRLTKPKFARKR